MRKGRRERIEKGSRKRIIDKRERDKRQFEEEGLRDPPFIEFSRSNLAIVVSSSPQGMTSWSSSIKIWFLQAYRIHY